ncbi:hypothetical protein [Micromonospora sp. CPCC 206061]|uniref:hypothetical protein n=1 Tax=Micromonospora sp. CPCC 206061 TaxID=3122410 RepID=UPI002FF3CBC7
MKRKLSNAGLLGRAAMSVAVAAALVTAPVAATPAQAAPCTADRVNALWPTPFSLQLMRDSTCQYYARLNIVDGTWGAGATIYWKVERLELTSYGYYVTAVQQRQRLWGTGQQDTARVPGHVNTSSAQDWHHACYSFDASSWTCTSPWNEY